MSGSSYWPMSAVYAQGTAPLSRIHATATEVSRPPEKAMPTRSPMGREVRTLDTGKIIQQDAWSCKRIAASEFPERHGRRGGDVQRVHSAPHREDHPHVAGRLRRRRQAGPLGAQQQRGPRTL